MVRLRKLVQAIAAASALTSGMAHALGLGDIHLRSALNQPLNAEIDLSDVRDLSAAEIIPKLASPEDFNKSGVDRNFFLTGLKFAAVVQPNGKSVIKVTSDRPVQEPYLNFLVEVVWPNGRLLREYTVLLDPPLYSPQAAAAAAAPRAPVAVPAPVVRQPVAAPTAPVAPRPAPAPAANTAGQLESGEYRTNSRDTLWEIAARARPDGSVTVNQTMLAIQDLNPNAFLDGNINRLKSGQVLRLPDAEQIKSRSQADADTQVRQQRSSWRGVRSAAPAEGARQLDATQRANAGAAPSEAQDKDNLRLVSGDAGKTKGGEKGGKDGKALSDKLAVTQESLDSTRRENDELQSRMQDLQGQLDKLNKLIQLKDAQLARLQGELGQAPTANASAPQPASAAPANTPAQPPASTPAPVATPESTPTAPAVPTTPVTPPAKPATPPPAARPPVVAPAPVAEEESLLDDIFGNPILLGAIAGSFVLVLLLLLLLMRRRAAQKEEAAVAAVADDHEPPLDEPLDMSHDSFAGLEDDTPAEVPVATALAAAEQTSAQTSDPLGEADIYIAYGRFNQAAELLQGAIYDEPNRSDLRLKLMEVFAEIGDRDGFVRQEAELREMGGSEPQIEQLKLRYPGMVAVAAASAAGSVAAVDALDDFNLDDLAFDAHDEPAAPPAAQAPASDRLDDAFDLGLDDLSFDEASTPAAPVKNDAFTLDTFDEQPSDASTKANDDFAFDLDLDADSLSAPGASAATDEFSLDLPETEASTAEADDFLLDLKDDSASLSSTAVDDFAFDLGEDEAPAKPEQPAALPDDFDLSLPDDAPAAAPASDGFAAQLDQVSAELDKLSSNLDDPQSSNAPLFAEPAVESASSLDDLEGDDDFDFLSGADEATTKLDLARAYIDMGDSEGARDILDEVIAEGNDAQQKEAREMIERLS